MNSQRKLFDEITSKENALAALQEEHRAACGHRRVRLTRLLETPEESALAFAQRVADPNFQMGEYVVFDRLEAGKMRHIEAPNVMDAVCIRMVARLTENQEIYNHMTTHSYCPVRNRGGLKLSYDAWHKVRELLYANKLWMKSHHGKRYVYFVKTDIRHFFPSISHSMAMKAVGKYIKNPDVLRLFDRMIGEHITIGSGLSAPVANAVLIDVDWEMESYPGVLGYYRYMDDVLWLFRSKAKAKAAIAHYEGLLKSMGLAIKPWRIERVTSAPFTIGGYKVRPSGIRPSSNICRHINRILRRISKRGVNGISLHDCATIASLNGYVTNSYAYHYKQIFANLNLDAAFARVGKNKGRKNYGNP